MPLHLGNVDEELAVERITAPKVSAHDKRFVVLSLGHSLQEDPKSYKIITSR